MNRTTWRVRLVWTGVIGIAFWLGFTPTALAGEVWINLTRTDVRLVNEPARLGVDGRIDGPGMK